MLLPLNVLEKLDSIAKQDSLSAMEKEIASAIDKITSSSAGDIALEMLHGSIKFCLKVAAAILVYIIGVWIIRKVRNNSKNAIISFSFQPALQ